MARPALGVLAVAAGLCAGGVSTAHERTLHNPLQHVGGQSATYCSAWEDGDGLVISNLQANSLAKWSASFRNCPDGTLSRFLFLASDERQPKRDAVQQDVREDSPLAGLAKPFDFHWTMENANRSQTETTSDNEMEERDRIREEARWTYISYPRNIQKLDALFKSYREEKSRTPSGVWKLTAAYSFLHTLKNDWTRPDDTGNPEDTDKAVTEKWAKEFPQSPTPYLFYAAIEFNRATAILHDRLARNTYPGGTTALRQKIIDARTALEAHKDIASQDPHYYKLMVEMLRAEGAAMDDILQVTFESGDRFPDYYDTYFETAGAIRNLSRKPGDDWEALANTAVAKSRSVIGDEMYARIYWIILLGASNELDWQRLKWDWSKMKASMRTIAKRYPSQWNIQHFAQFSCFMHDAETTREMLDAVKGLPLSEVWSQTEVFDVCRQFADASSEPQDDPQLRKAGTAAH